MSHCLWNNHEGHHSYHLANWQGACLRKENGGLGILDLRNLNLCLLGSWVRRYEESKGKLWRRVVDSKYRVNVPNLFYCRSYNVSRFWKGVPWAARAAKFGFRWDVGNGEKVKFREDIWIGTSSLAIQF